MDRALEKAALEAWENLSFSDNFIFQRVMKNKDLCKRLIEKILNIKIKDIDYPETEKSIDNRQDSKSVRLDVYVEDDKGTVYDIEMQTSKGKDGELAKRARYYQGMIDMDLLSKGVFYEDLRKTFIIFICTFDLFGKGERIYTFRNICKEAEDLELGDEATKIFLNAAGIKGNIDKDLEGVLGYVDKREAKGKLAEDLAKEVDRVKISKEMRRKYMTLFMEYRKHHRDGYEDGYKKGIEEGIEKGMEKGMEQGKYEGEKMMYELLLHRGKSLQDLSELFGKPVSVIENIIGSQ